MHAYVCTYVHTYIHIYICMYMYMSLSLSLYIYIYIHMAPARNDVGQVRDGFRPALAWGINHHDYEVYAIVYTTNTRILVIVYTTTNLLHNSLRNHHENYSYT